MTLRCKMFGHKMGNAPWCRCKRWDGGGYARKHVCKYSNETPAFLLVSWVGMDLPREDAEAAGMLRRSGGADA